MLAIELAEILLKNPYYSVKTLQLLPDPVDGFDRIWLDFDLDLDLNIFPDTEEIYIG